MLSKLYVYTTLILFSFMVSSSSSELRSVEDSGIDCQKIIDDEVIMSTYQFPTGVIGHMATVLIFAAPLNIWNVLIDFQGQTEYLNGVDDAKIIKETNNYKIAVRKNRVFVFSLEYTIKIEFIEANKTITFSLLKDDKIDNSLEKIGAVKSNFLDDIQGIWWLEKSLLCDGILLHYAVYAEPKISISKWFVNYYVKHELYKTVKGIKQRIYKVEGVD